MAQIECRFFNPDICTDTKQQICELAQTAVFETHYPDDVNSRLTADGSLRLQPGDITLVVPVLDTGLSVSDADVELEISEGSDNWPKDSMGALLANDAAKDELSKRAERISNALSHSHEQLSHNIFEVNGCATGWVAYKPDNATIV